MTKSPTMLLDKAEKVEATRPVKSFDLAKAASSGFRKLMANQDVLQEAREVGQKEAFLLKNTINLLKADLLCVKLFSNNVGRINENKFDEAFSDAREALKKHPANEMIISLAYDIFTVPCEMFMAKISPNAAFTENLRLSRDGAKLAQEASEIVGVGSTLNLKYEHARRNYALFLAHQVIAHVHIHKQNGLIPEKATPHITEAFVAKMPDFSRTELENAIRFISSELKNLKPKGYDVPVEESKDSKA